MLLGKQGAGQGHAGRRGSRSTTASSTSSTGDVFRAAAARGHAARPRGQALHGHGRARPRRHRDRRRRASTSPARRPRRRTASSSTASRARSRRPRSSSSVLDDHPLDLVINLDVPTEIVLAPHRRAAGVRRSAAPRTTSTIRRRTNWTCDVCGGEVVQRDDDTEEAVMRRLELYERQTVPIIDFYRALGQARRTSTATATATRCSSALRRGPIDSGDVPVRAAADDHPEDRRPDRAHAAGRQGRRRDARGVHPRREARRDDARRRRAPRARCSTDAAPARTSSATTASRRWCARRPTT